MKLKATIAIIASLLIAGCSLDTEKFIPDVFKSSAGISTNQYSVKHGKQVFNIIRDGVTFTDGSYITANGEGSIILPKGYYYVSSDSGRVLAADKLGNIMVLKSNGEEKKIIYQKEFNGGSVVDNRLANPIVTQNFLAIPTLDGKLVFISLHTYRPPAVLPIGTLKNYGNMIFLKPLNSKIIAATPTNIIAISKTGKQVYDAKVADLTIHNGIIYLLTRDGQVVKLDSNLQLIKSKKFAYADYATIAAMDGKIYAFAKSGSLVVMDDNMQKHKVYSVGAAKNYSFVSGKWLYIDDRKVDLLALSYE